MASTWTGASAVGFAPLPLRSTQPGPSLHFAPRPSKTMLRTGADDTLPSHGWLIPAAACVVLNIGGRVVAP